MNMTILKKYPEEVLAIINEVFPPDWEIYSAETEKRFSIPENTEILIPSHSAVERELLDKVPGLKIIQTGAGYDNVDLEACREKGIRVLNAPAVNTAEVAEHAFAFIFSWFKRTEILNNDIRLKGWSIRKDGKALSDLRIGIIGYGNIGKKVSDIAKVLGMKITVFSEHSDKGFREGVLFTDKLEKLLCESDIVTLHTSADKNNFNMISDREFSIMKENAFFINTSRGSLLDEDALCRALDSGKIAGAALDVFKKEPLPHDSRLRNYSSIIMTPHNAGEPDLYNSYRKRFTFFYVNIMKALENRDPEGVII